VREVNRRLVDNAAVQGEGGFITLLYCALNTSTHCMQWTSAGHPVPLLHNLRTNEITSLAGGSGGMPLGISGDEMYTTETILIPEDSRLLFYSDGLADAFGPQSDGCERFGEEGILATLKKTANLPVEQAMRRLFDDSSAFTDGQGRHDDTSAVLLERYRPGR
jgi:serine phosphatase RsbU (regulator of sigma subunit)